MLASTDRSLPAFSIEVPALFGMQCCVAVVRIGFGLEFGFEPGLDLDSGLAPDLARVARSVE